MYEPALFGILFILIFLPILCGLLTLSTEPVRGYECMESPGCPDHVQRCFDGICTPISSCGSVHWDNGSACNCTRDIGKWTIQATGSCNAPG